MAEPGLGELAADRARIERESTAGRVSEVLRSRIAEGYFRPGTRLPEDAIRGALGVSRNTLREAFRLLSHERLVEHSLNRGVFVRVPTIEDLEDIYRVRRTIECAAVSGVRSPPDLSTLEARVKAGRAALRHRAWQDLGTANIRFHEGIAAFLGSTRVDELMSNVLAELRLVFHMMESPRALHEPYLPRNVEILDVLRRGEGKRAERLLNRYLDDAYAQFAELYSRQLKGTDS